MLDGKAPAPATLRLDGDPVCVSLNGGNRRSAEFIVVGEGNALSNVFVYVSGGLEKSRFAAPAVPVTLDQQACRYVPHVLGIQVGQSLHIRNSDAVLHNVRANAKGNQPFNLGQPVRGMIVTRTFTTPEVMVPIKCDVHGWMNAYVGVLDHPFHSVTGATGEFSLDGLPPGIYTIEAWHETLGTQSQQVTIRAGQTQRLKFSFKLSEPAAQ